MFSLPNIAFSQTHQYQNAAPGYFDTHLDAASEIAARCAAVATHGDNSAGLYGSKPHYFGEFGLKGRLAVSIRYNVMSTETISHDLESNVCCVTAKTSPGQERREKEAHQVKFAAAILPIDRRWSIRLGCTCTMPWQRSLLLWPQVD